MWRWRAVLLEPGVKLELLQRGTLLRLMFKTLTQHIPAIIRQLFTDADFFTQELSGLKCHTSVQHIKQHHAQLPHRSGTSTVGPVPKLFWWDVLCCTKEARECWGLVCEAAVAKVNQPQPWDISAGVNQDVFYFDVPVEDVLWLQLFGRFHQLLHQQSGLLLLQDPSFVFVLIVKEVNTGGRSFQDQDQLLVQKIMIQEGNGSRFPYRSSCSAAHPQHDSHLKRKCATILSGVFLCDLFPWECAWLPQGKDQLSCDQHRLIPDLLHPVPPAVDI